jgi:hypothetical protein
VALSKHEVPVPDLPQLACPIAAFTFDPQQNRPDIAAIYFCHGGNVVLTREKLLKRLEACKRRIGSAEIDIMHQRALIARTVAIGGSAERDRKVLATFEESLAVHREWQRMILQELAKRSPTAIP